MNQIIGTTATTHVKRKKFQGALYILSFNRHFYFLGVGALVLFVGAYSFFHWPTYILVIGLIAFVYGLLAPLVVSAYVYDFSGYYDLEWLDKLIKNTGAKKLMININAGFDETSHLLERKYPNAEIRAFDFYDAKKHTELAIVRARKVNLVYPNTLPMTSSAIPLPDHSADVILLLSSAHEIRSHEEKIRLFQECHRICKTDGQLIMIEHLRDFPNFIAFHIGFFHFFSASTWKDAIQKGGFSKCETGRFTPFMGTFRCE